MTSTEISITTTKRTQFVSITSKIAEVIAKAEPSVKQSAGSGFKKQSAGSGFKDCKMGFSASEVVVSTPFTK